MRSLTRMSNDTEMARRLHAARTMTGLDQGKFADLTGISRSIISQYETGANTHYKWPVLVTWAYYSPVTLDWLVTGEHPSDNHPLTALARPGSRGATGQYQRRLAVVRDLPHARRPNVVPLSRTA